MPEALHKHRLSTLRANARNQRIDIPDGALANAHKRIGEGITASSIARELGIGRATLMRHIRDWRTRNNVQTVAAERSQTKREKAIAKAESP